MRPTLTTHNSMALLTADAVKCAKFDKGYAAFCVALANGLYVGFCKLGLNVIFTSFIYKSIARMQDVLPMSYPFKVAYMVVCRVVINVIYFFAWMLPAKKDNRNQTMNKGTLLCTFSAKLNSAMAILATRWDKNFSTSNAKYIPMVGDFVKSFKARNWLPSFGHHQPLLVVSSVGVAWQLAQKPAFGSYPSQAGEF